MSIVATEPAYKISRTSSGLTYRDISDDYVNWLCFANAGMLNRGNLWAFDHAIANLPGDQPIVEIGSFCGLSTNLLSYYKQRHGKSNCLFTCDAWNFERDDNPNLGQSSIPHDRYRTFVRDAFIRNVKFFSEDDLPFTIEATSERFFQHWREVKRMPDVFGRPAELGGPVAFCYIDGNHSYECTIHDFRSVDEFLIPGGFILFDDSADGSHWGSNQACLEVARDSRYEIVIKNPNYLVRKR